MKKKIKTILETLPGKVEYLGGDFFSVCLSRGPRIDHGGGAEGDDWLNDSQVNQLWASMKERHKSTINRIKKQLNEISPDIKIDTSYDEKGYFCLNVWI